MLSRTTWRLRKAIEAAEDFTSGADRYTDFGVNLHVVVQDLEHGREVEQGMAPVRIIRTHRFGGLFDTRTQRWSGPSRDPVDWFCSEAQEPVLLHRGELAPKLLVYGAEGAGKSRALAMWLILRAVEYAGLGGRGGARRFAGATSPTRDKSIELLKALRAVMRPSWGRWYAGSREMELALGITIQLRATKLASKDVGSPIQSFNWLFAGSDELQDSIHANGDIEGRLRSSPGGIGKRMNTATAKDLPAWRTFRDSLFAARSSDGRSLWGKVHWNGPSNPFVYPQHWENMKALGEREYRRRVLAEDVRPENATYPDWDRAIHVMPEPDTWPDRTEFALSRFQSYQVPGASFLLLAAHDPGEIVNTTTFLRVRRHRDNRGRPVLKWLVVGEFITERTTSDQHAARLRRHLQSEYGLNFDPGPLDGPEDSPRALVICDPHGPGEDRPHLDAYRAFQRHGFDIFRADEKRIPRNARIEVVNRVLLAADGTVRLYAASGMDGKPLAPKFVESVESQERDASGRAEMNPKNARDTSHSAASVGYGLWPFEREHLTTYTLADSEGRDELD